MPQYMVAGVIAPLWMLLGVIFVARLYPGYGHRQQVMSELGARDRATTKIHPWINNYPIGFWFVLFGVALLKMESTDNLLFLTGILMVVQGVSHWVTGLFPCDEDLGIPKSSVVQIIHNLAGLVMYFSLLAACLLWVIRQHDLPQWFTFYSAASAAISVVTLVLMLRALKTNINVGLYQRINYGALAAWVMVMSVMLMSV
ncbi:DUF998 domain-containing protein [Cellvibrio sp. OA-2007]|uniref:DUF998 domain-containing protein n=1 Tax=Cellvibrio sp. OA-2007 TaxID=529823 RepID=UPI0007854BDD|nr:DUF998 domain-containing protein [Cellvibrio sp. OA-2007]